MLWRVRDARLTLAAGGLVTSALGLTSVAAMLRVHDSGAGPVATAGLLLCLSVPAILLMGLAGSLSDRYDSRLLLVVGTLAQAVALAGLVLLHDLPSTFVLIAASSTAASLAAPVWTAILPSLAGEERTGVLVSAQQGIRAVTFPAGAALAGMLVDLAGDGAAFAAAALLLLAAAALAALIRVRRGDGDETSSAVSLLPLSALQALKGHPVAYVLVLSVLPFVVAAEAVNPAEVFLVRDILDASAAQFGLAAAATGAGTVLGSFAAGALTRPQRRLPLTVISLLLTGAIQAGQGIAPDYLTYLVLSLAVGIVLGLANALIFVVILDGTPDRVRGRVIALVVGLSRTAAIGATALGGILATTLGPRPTYIAAGALGLLTATGATWAIRRYSGDPDRVVESQN